jgi:hypothetical protein
LEVPAIYQLFYDGFSGGCAGKTEVFLDSDLEVLCGLGVFSLVSWWWLGDEVVVDLAVSAVLVVGDSGGGYGIWVIEVMWWWLMPM